MSIILTEQLHQFVDLYAHHFSKLSIPEWVIPDFERHSESTENCGGLMWAKGEIRKLIYAGLVDSMEDDLPVDLPLLEEAAEEDVEEVMVNEEEEESPDENDANGVIGGEGIVRVVQLNGDGQNLLGDDSEDTPTRVFETSDENLSELLEFMQSGGNPFSWNDLLLRFQPLRQSDVRIKVAKLYTIGMARLLHDYHTSPTFAHIDIISYFYDLAKTSGGKIRHAFDSLVNRRISVEKLMRKSRRPLIFEFPLLDMAGSLNDVSEEPLSSQHIFEQDWKLIFYLLDCYIEPTEQDWCTSRIWDDLTFNERVKDVNYFHMIEQALKYLDVDPRIDNPSWAAKNPRDAMMKKSPLVIFKDADDYLRQKREHDERTQRPTTTTTRTASPMTDTFPFPTFEEFLHARMHRHGIRRGGYDRLVPGSATHGRKPTVAKLLFALIVFIRPGSEHRLAENYLRLIRQHASNDYADQCLFAIYLIVSSFNLLGDNIPARRWLEDKMYHRLAKRALQVRRS